MSKTTDPRHAHFLSAGMASEDDEQKKTVVALMTEGLAILEKRIDVVLARLDALETSVDKIVEERVHEAMDARDVRKTLKRKLSQVDDVLEDFLFLQEPRIKFRKMHPLPDDFDA